MKKIFTSVLFAAMSAGLLAGCATATTVTPKAFATNDEVTGFQTVSAVSLLDDIKFAEGDLPSSETSSETSSEVTSSDPTSTEVSSEASSEVTSEVSSEVVSSETSSETSEVPVETVDVTKYLGIMEQLLSDHPIQMVTEASDLAEYTYKMTITTTDLNGVVSTFVLYYNELVTDTTDTSSETSSEAILGKHGDGGMGGMGDHGNWNDNHDGSETSETTEETGDANEYQSNHDHHHVGDIDEEGNMTNLEGIIFVNGVQYDLVGKKNDTETRFFVSIDEANWIRVSSSIDGNEESYKYTVSVDGVRSKFSFKLETEDNGDLKVTVKSISGGLQTSYKFYKTVDADGNEVIYILKTMAIMVMPAAAETADAVTKPR
ncbi:MAG: hypothetical protein NTV44_01590 [Firmicutes bacterium]|nr:hypothetical protein [Bacillota bacterium]